MLIVVWMLACPINSFWTVRGAPRYRPATTDSCAEKYASRYRHRSWLRRQLCGCASFESPPDETVCLWPDWRTATLPASGHTAPCGASAQGAPQQQFATNHNSLRQPPRAGFMRNSSKDPVVEHKRVVERPGVFSLATSARSAASIVGQVTSHVRPMFDAGSRRRKLSKNVALSPYM